MAYQPPNDVADAKAMDVASYTSVHLFAGQAQTATNVTIYQVGCGWNQSSSASAGSGSSSGGGGGGGSGSGY